MQKLTEAEVLAAWRNEKTENVLSTPTTLDLKRMRATLNKRAERLRKKNAAGLTAATAVRPSLDEQVAALTNVEAPLPVSNFEIHTGADFEDHSAPADPVETVALGTSAGFPEHVSCDGEDMTVVEARAAARFPDAGDTIAAAVSATVTDEAGAAQVADPAPAIRRRYTFVPVLSGGMPLPEVKVDVFSEKEGNKLVWAGLTDAQKDNCEYLDFVDVQDIPAPTRLLVVAGNSAVAAAVASMGKKAQMVSVVETCAPPTISDVKTITTEETEMAGKKKAKTSKKAGRRIPREEIVKSAAHIALFEKAIANSRDPKRTHCKNNHTITPAHAHVGDLKRTGRYTCDPCNTDAQAKYNAAKK